MTLLVNGCSSNSWFAVAQRRAAGPSSLDDVDIVHTFPRSRDNVVLDVCDVTPAENLLGRLQAALFVANGNTSLGGGAAARLGLSI